MKVSGFTFVKNATEFHFPVVESISSMLPVCDEVIVNVGLPDRDSTLRLVEGIENRKIKVITTEWDPFLKVGGRVLAQQTDIALRQCKGDWCLYLQADEVLHEEDYEKISLAMERNLDDDRVEALLFNFIHFFGDYRTYIRSYHWYQREIRIVRNHLGITSWRDAQGFRLEGRKLRVKETGARIFHYGWVRPADIMGVKKDYQDTLHHGGAAHRRRDRVFEFHSHIDPSLMGQHNGTHPEVMESRIEKWGYRLDKTKSTHSLTLSDIRCRVTDVFARITGIRIGEYRNYTLLKK